MDLRVEDLPFFARDPLEVFGIVRGRSAPDLSGDYLEHGYTSVGELVLASDHGPPSVLRDPLVLVLHSPEIDHPHASADEPEVELELELGAGPTAEIASVLVPLHRFLDGRATRVIGDARDVVLAWCNPRRLRPSAPQWLHSTRRLHFASGDVVSWLDTLDDGRERFRLQAERWHVLSDTRPPSR